MTTLENNSTPLDEAASRSSGVSDVTRVTSSPLGRPLSAPMCTRNSRRTMELRASSTTCSASRPSRIHWNRPSNEPNTSNATSSQTASAIDVEVSNPSRIHFVASVPMASGRPAHPRVGGFSHGHQSTGVGH